MYGGQADWSDQLSGTAVALLVPMAAACNWTVVQHSQSQGQKIDLVPAVLVGALLSCLLTLPLAWPLAATPHDVGLLGLLGLMQLAIPCALSVWCATVLKAPEISLLALLEIVFGILLAWVGAGEVPGSSVLYGGALVVGALVINELMAWREKA
jgi:drug/metabolite transporter (DMT)-like permease